MADKLVKKTVTQVRKAIRENGKWEGYLVGNKVNRFNIDMGWNLGARVELDTLEALEKTCNTFLYYLPAELGNRVAFYEIVTAETERTDDK